MSNTKSPSFTIIEAYKLMGYFAEQALTKQPDNSSAYFQEQLRIYMRGVLTNIDPSLTKIAESWVLSQTTESELGSLQQMVNLAENTKIKQLVNQVLSECTDLVELTNINARIVLIIGDGNNQTLTQAMQNAIGVSLGSKISLIFFWPQHQWKDSLSFAVAHEYSHLCQNSYVEKRFIDGKMINGKTGKPDTLLDAVLNEGISDAFAMSLQPSFTPNWIHPLPIQQETLAWEAMSELRDSEDPLIIRSFLAGSTPTLPDWAGQYLGYKIVSQYITNNPKVDFENLYTLGSEFIYNNSGYTPGL
ncbi:MAG: DUF2268 domain-containing putative Zn-dependent protease [Chloroflexota bacterium]|nr:DUF2268 domain-containing putative Zn-dependent protease [Chloroflexota bacterium]|tara:strand:+ start:4114 stop:5022 length:909 start_codon:yes stop_codon:yes gene_type:complete